MTDPTEVHWTEGVCGDGAAILYDGAPVSIACVLEALNDRDRLRSTLTVVRNGIENDPGNLNLEAIVDTVWVSSIETMVDFIDAALARAAALTDGGGGVSLPNVVLTKGKGT
jgi:hypothetical protein